MNHLKIYEYFVVSRVISMDKIVNIFEKWEISHVLVVGRVRNNFFVK